MDTDNGNYNNYSNYGNNSNYDISFKIRKVLSWLIVIITIGLVLMSIAIFALFSLVKKDNVAPIYVINLLISDVFQLCSFILMEIGGKDGEGVFIAGLVMCIFGLAASVNFMLCVALERYLAIVWPVWYRTRQTVKKTLVVCAVVWTLALTLYLLYLLIYLVTNGVIDARLMFAIFLLLLPFPLLIFFLVSTLKALSASISVCAEEKRRIAGLLILVLLIYTLLFLPAIISIMIKGRYTDLHIVSLISVSLNPVADLFLYIFLRKGFVDQVWFCLCCCRKNRTSRQSSSGLNDGNTVTSL